MPGCMSASSSIVSSRLPLLTTWVWSACSGLTVHLVHGLGAGAHDHRVDVDVPRAGDDPRDAVSDVVGDEDSRDAVVHRVGALLVTGKTHERELLGVHHAGGELCHA